MYNNNHGGGDNNNIERKLSFKAVERDARYTVQAPASSGLHIFMACLYLTVNEYVSS